jgi:H+/Cl- antiporter ClcA
MSKSWLWVFVVWFISLLVGVLWGLLSLPGIDAPHIGEGLGKYSATVQAVSPALLVLLVLALVLLTLAYAILTHKLRRATDHLRPSRRLSPNFSQRINVPICALNLLALF